MKVIKLRVAGRSGYNGRPSSGDVTFDDGNAYGWFRLPEGGIRFSGHRKRANGGYEMFIFSSAAREAALEACIETL